MTNKMLRFSFPFGFILFNLFLYVGIPSLSWTQDYPAQTVQIIACWPPGGFSSIMAPMIAEEAKKYLTTPVVAVYKPGAAGTIGAYYVAKAAPDGYNLVVGTFSNIVIAPLIQKLEYSPHDFELISQIAINPYTIVVRSDAPWKTLKDLVNYAKKNPEALSCGNGGTYSGHHLVGIQLEKIAGIKIAHVPFKGAADSMASLAGGHVSMVIRSLGEGEALIDAGKVRVLSVFDSKRCRFYPDVPTAKEEEFSLDAGAWGALMAPKGTPKTILSTWETIMRKMTLDKAFIEKGDKMKMNIESKSTEETRKYFERKLGEYSEIIKQLGLKPT